MNIEKLTPEELVALQAQISNRLEQTRQERLAQLRQDIDSLIQKSGFTSADVFPAKSSSSASRKPAAIKYQKDANTWTGKGKRPRWLTDYLASGGALSDLLVK